MHVSFWSSVSTSVVCVCCTALSQSVKLSVQKTRNYEQASWYPCHPRCLRAQWALTSEILSCRPATVWHRNARPLGRALDQSGGLFPAVHLLQGTEMTPLATPEASLKRLVPLVDFLAVWKLLQPDSTSVTLSFQRRLGGCVRSQIFVCWTTLSNALGSRCWLSNRL